MPANHEFQIAAPDVGQGTAILVSTKHHHLLFDTGTKYENGSDIGKSVVVPLLQAKKIKLDTLVLSHGDMDHIGGAATVLKSQTQATLLSSLPNNHPLLLSQPKKRNTQRCVAGQQWQWDGVRFQSLHPPEHYYQGNYPTNAMSCVLLISNGKHTALLTGDISAKQEKEILGSHSLGKIDFLQIPHHGSQTSSSALFVQSLSPKVALVQTGYQNRYRHPHSTVVHRYQEVGTRLINSVDCGALEWSSQAPEKIGCWRDQYRRYWNSGF